MANSMDVSVSPAESQPSLWTSLADSRFAPGRYLRQFESGHLSAGRALGAGNGFGVPVCSGGCLYDMIMLQALHGAGDTVTPTIVNFFGFWLLEIPLAYWLAIPPNLRSNEAFYAIVIAEPSVAVASAILFPRGRWKSQRM